MHYDPEDISLEDFVTLAEPMTNESTALASSSVKNGVRAMGLTTACNENFDCVESESSSERGEDTQKT